jgi:hypothetical protein
VNYRQAVVIGILLGVTAALVVWYLERFEVAKLHGEVRDYLGRYDEFTKWEQTQGGAGD